MKCDLNGEHDPVHRAMNRAMLRACTAPTVEDGDAGWAEAQALLPAYEQAMAALLAKRGTP